MFRGKINPVVLGCYLLSCLFISSFFVLSVPSYFGIELSTITLHKLHDFLLWSGTCFLVYVLEGTGVISTSIRKTIIMLNFVALLFIAVSQNLDQSQIGTTIAYPGMLVLLSYAMVRNMVEFARIRDISSALRFLAVMTFCVTGMNDILIGLIGLPSIPLWSVGSSFTLIFVAFRVNDLINQTYRERDYLRENLEKEVQEKTKSLQEKSSSLEKALNDLKLAQVEILQSSKLAALGTLSAGIAHEINNALNYVRGSIGPLGKLLQKPEMEDKDKTKAQQLIKLMGEGLTLTSDIILNLKRYTRNDSGETENVSLLETIQGTMVLLKGRIENGIQVEVNVSPELIVPFSRVSLSQLLLNLIGNSVDAFDGISDRPRVIQISSESTSSEVVLRIAG